MGGKGRGQVEEETFLLLSCAGPKPSLTARQRCCLRSHIRYAAGPPSGDAGNSMPQLFHSFLFKSFLLKLQHANACPQKDVPSSANLLLWHNTRQYHKLLAALLAHVVPKAHSRLCSSFGRNQHTVSGWPPVAAARPCPSVTLAPRSTAPCCTRCSLEVPGPSHTDHAVKTSLCRYLETSLRALQLLITNPEMFFAVTKSEPFKFMEIRWPFWREASVGAAQSCARESSDYMRKHFFTLSVVKHWNRPPREVPDAHTCQCLREVWMMPSTMSFNNIWFVDAYRKFAYWNWMGVSSCLIAKQMTWNTQVLSKLCFWMDKLGKATFNITSYNRK